MQLEVEVSSSAELIFPIYSADRKQLWTYKKAIVKYDRIVNSDRKSCFQFTV